MDPRRSGPSQEVGKIGILTLKTTHDSPSPIRRQEKRLVRSQSGNMRLSTSVAPAPVNRLHGTGYDALLSLHQDVQMHSRSNSNGSLQLNSEAAPFHNGSVLHSGPSGRQDAGVSVAPPTPKCCNAPDIGFMDHEKLCFTCGSVIEELGSYVACGEDSSKNWGAGWYQKSEVNQDRDSSQLLLSQNYVPMDTSIEHSSLSPDHDAHTNDCSSSDYYIHRSSPARPSHANGLNTFSSQQTRLPYAVLLRSEADDDEQVQQTDSTGADNSESGLVFYGPMTRMESARAQKAAAWGIAQNITAWSFRCLATNENPSADSVQLHRPPRQLPPRLQAAVDRYRVVPVPHPQDQTAQEAAAAEPPDCAVCLQQHDPTEACLTCTECSGKGHEAGSPNCPGPPPTFTLFTALPTELRKRIYAYALISPRAILPHLCDSALKFHDDNARGKHGSVSALLGVTFVSKQLHAEALPVFYAANTFAIGTDTASYFDRLVSLGRFALLRNVQFDIRKRHADTAAITLRSMTQYLAEATSYETQLAALHGVDASSPRAVAALVGSRHGHLVRHPQYTTGGLNDLFPFICLRKLTSPSPRTGLPTLVLPVPHSSLFADYASLTWFPTMCFGLNVSLHFIPHQPLTLTSSSDSSCISIVWRQKYQKKDFDAEEEQEGEGMKEAGEREAVYARAIEMFPTLEIMNRPRVNAYMRFRCNGEFREWRDVQTVGGGYCNDDD